MVSCTTLENLPVTDQEAAAAVAAVHEMLGPGQVRIVVPLSNSYQYLSSVGALTQKIASSQLCRDMVKFTWRKMPSIQRGFVN